MIKLVAFDWNGTLFADTRAIFESDNEVIKLLNLKPVSFKTFQEYFDVPVEKYYLALGVSIEELNRKTSEIQKAFHTNYELRAAKVRTRSGAKELLSWLSKNKINSVIFSNHVITPIKKQLKRLKIENYFSEVLANSNLETAFKSRSKKERLQNYMRNNNVLADETMIIGDTIEEIEIGKEIGVITVAITNGNCSKTRLKAKKPDYLINNLKELIGVVQKITPIKL